MTESNAITELFKRLRLSRSWVVAQFGWVLAWIWVNLAMLYLPAVLRWPEWLSDGLRVSYSGSIMIVAFVVQAGMLRCLMSSNTRRVRLVWGALALLLWGVLYGAAISMQEDYVPGKVLQWLLPWVVTPAIMFPFAAASALWGFRLPWRRALRVVGAWRWWLGVLLAGAVGYWAEHYSEGVRGYPYVWDVSLARGLKLGADDMLEMGVWILLLGWLAVLFDHTAPSAGEDLVGDSAPL